MTDGPEPPTSSDGAGPMPTEPASEPGLTEATPGAELEPPAVEHATDLAPATADLVPAPITGPAPPAVESNRRLIGASFDLLTRTSDDMRRASFYIGAVVLGTIGPLALATFALEVVSIHTTRHDMERLLAAGAGFWYGLLVTLAGIGVLVAGIESQAMATAILGGRQAGRPITVRAALQRSRAVFGRVLVAGVIVGIPVGIAQSVVNAAFEGVLGPETDISLVSSALVAGIVGAPLAYLLGGVVLGDVDPAEATRRSFRVFRARKLAAALVAIFQTIAVLLIVLGLGGGLDLALRVFDALGLGAGSGPAGLTLVVIGILVGVFALGTLIYTAMAISIAPQVVMFVGLTHATSGLDHVRPGGDRDPDLVRSGVRRFRWLTRCSGSGPAWPDSPASCSPCADGAWPGDSPDQAISRCPARSGARHRCRGGGRARGRPSPTPRRPGRPDRRSQLRAAGGRA